MSINISDDRQKLAHIFPDIMFASLNPEYVIGVIQIDGMCKASILIYLQESSIICNDEYKTFEIKYNIFVYNSHGIIISSIQSFDGLNQVIDCVSNNRTEDKFMGG
jgi:hypothetical protein